MNVLLATSFFPPTHTAGTEKRTLGYAKALLELGHRVQVLCVGNWDQGQNYWNGFSDEVFQGIPVRRIHLNWQKSPDPNRYLYDNPETARFFGQCLTEWRPDLVHITSCLTLSASIIAEAKEHSLPVVLTLTDFWFVCHKLSLLKYDGSLCDGITTSRDCIQCLCWNSGAYQRLKKISSAAVATGVVDALSKFPAINRQRGLRGLALDIAQRKEYLTTMLNAADIVTAPSNHLYQTLRGSGIEREIRVVQSGHDLSWLDALASKSPSERVRFGYIGQFIPTKGVHVLLEAFGGRDWKDKAELHLFGNPNGNPAYWQRLQQIENCNPEMVFFHGPFPHEKLGEILSGLDVLIVPSLWHENNPRVIQEAFAGKTPVIASNVGGIAEFVEHDRSGLLFERGSSEQLSGCIQDLVDHPEKIQSFVNRLPRVKSIRNEIDEFTVIYATCASLEVNHENEGKNYSPYG
jgi:glycosyltransferase involved in cell wall biosynthesis